MSISSLNPYRTSSLHHDHLAMGAKMVMDEGWMVPEYYKSLEEEKATAEKSVALFDLSPVAKVMVDGLDIDKLLSSHLQGPVPRPRRSMRLSMPSVGETFGTRLASDEILLLAKPSSREPLASSLESMAKGCFHVTDLTSAFTGIGLAGPRARGLLMKVTELDVSEPSFPDLASEGCAMAEVHAMLVRSDLQGLLCYQVYCDRGYGKNLWEELLAAGKEFGVTPVGLRTWHSINGGRWL